MVLRRRANSRFLEEARKVRARLIARLARAERSQAGEQTAALYRSRLEELDRAIRGLSGRDPEPIVPLRPAPASPRPAAPRVAAGQPLQHS